MRKLVLFFLLVFGLSNYCQSQEWFTSLESAKRLALIQDKMIFMMWEEATLREYPVLVMYDDGNVMVQDLFKSETVLKIIWDHFVPVKVSEDQYPDLYNEIKNLKSQSYINKFNDDSIKIMDVNGNIVNTNLVYGDYLNILEFINLYALNTSFLKAELTNYRDQNDFNSTLRLATKYIDFAILVNDKVRPEIIKLSTIYLDETSNLLSALDIESKSALQERVELLKIYQNLVLNKPKKVLRQLKKFDTAEMEVTNESLVAFMYFTSYLLLKDENNASPWRSKVSLLNLKKANLIINNKL